MAKTDSIGFNLFGAESRMGCHYSIIIFDEILRLWNRLTEKSELLIVHHSYAIRLTDHSICHIRSIQISVMLRQSDCIPSNRSDAILIRHGYLRRRTRIVIADPLGHGHRETFTVKIGCCDNDSVIARGRHTDRNLHSCPWCPFARSIVPAVDLQSIRKLTDKNISALSIRRHLKDNITIQSRATKIKIQSAHRRWRFLWHVNRYIHAGKSLSTGKFIRNLKLA